MFFDHPTELKFLELELMTEPSASLENGFRPGLAIELADMVLTSSAIGVSQWTTDA
jgi:hypothetical protein